MTTLVDEWKGADFDVQNATRFITIVQLEH